MHVEDASVQGKDKQDLSFSSASPTALGAMPCLLPITLCLLPITSKALFYDAKESGMHGYSVVEKLCFSTTGGGKHLTLACIYW